jgi:polar amino acid transport system permease protein
MPLLLRGAGIAVTVVLCAEMLGTILGLGLALLRLSGRWWLSMPALVYVDVIRGTPMLVQILFVYFGIPSLFSAATGRVFSLGSRFDAYYPYIAGISALGLNSAAYVSEIYRTAISSIDKGQAEAARALGLSRTQTFRFVVFPQAFRWAVPPLGNEFITLLKDTSLLSVIAVMEIVKQGQLYMARTYAVFPSYLAVALVYLVMTFTIATALRYVERKMQVPG